MISHFFFLYFLFYSFKSVIFNHSSTIIDTQASASDDADHFLNCDSSAAGSGVCSDKETVETSIRMPLNENQKCELIMLLASLNKRK